MDPPLAAGMKRPKPIKREIKAETPSMRNAGNTVRAGKQELEFVTQLDAHVDFSSPQSSEIEQRDTKSNQVLLDKKHSERLNEELTHRNPNPPPEHVLHSAEPLEQSEALGVAFIPRKHHDTRGDVPHRDGSQLQRGKELLHSSSVKVQDTGKIPPYASQALLKISTVSKLNWFNNVKFYPKRSGRVKSFKEITGI
ncbi:hypothetical protein DUI87_14982 [Hirundo rustica rustica]|uniref:Uncharacterized protein n=1 Tax=Hirundo rustica rustica TaxID=333673 RepID=A0A3M0K6B6_HIRRU|nr:hypothetical protein DUI87_14982 [Hirundo rustica rustica]